MTAGSIAERWHGVDAYWRAANYLSVGQIYLLGDDPLLRGPLVAKQVKQRLLGHWGTTPGLNAHRDCTSDANGAGSSPRDNCSQ